ncbi:MAG: hypothetical protein K2Q10_06590 [Rhodospirillales bacterium]|nr:hypothetical protein [Rhodospirillales bacterium]
MITRSLVALAMMWGVAGAAKAADYEVARWSPLHFKPAIETATDQECLSCHKEILDHKIRDKSPAGVDAQATLAWYQTLDTYTGNQDDFHRRHLTSDYAKQVMDLKCNTCHQGNDPREEAPQPDTYKTAGFTLRKMVDPTKTCLLCHGQFPYQNMTGLEGPWHQARETFENPDQINGCLSCHGEGGFRSARHQVNYLKAAAIEEAAKTKADVCFGCHGGRSWYRISYPYPRHPWPGMDTEVPDWAKDRPTESEARFLLGVKK